VTGDGCREAVLAAFDRLERRHDKRDFPLVEIVAEVQAVTDTFRESTIRTHVLSRMCRQAAANHAVVYPDLDRVGRGVYRRH
jgi:hypothetical protein